MTKISLNLPEHLSNSPADLSRTNGVNDDILRDCTEHEKALAAKIEMAVNEVDQGKFASNDLVAVIRARRWGRKWIGLKLSPTNR